MEENEKSKSKISKILSMALTIAFLVFVLAMVLRICQADHKELENLYITDSFLEAYEISQDLRTHAAGTEFSENGALYAYSFVYIEKAEYFQITVRYNKRHIDEVVSAINANEKALYGESAKTYTVEDIGIRYEIEDSKGNKYTPKILATDEAINYGYFKFEVTGVSFTDVAINAKMILENVEKTTLEIDGASKTTLIYKEGSVYNEENGTLEVHSLNDMSIEYKLSKKEKAELEK